MVQKAGIVISAADLPIFKRHLQQSGYVYEKEAKLDDDTVILTVLTGNLGALGIVLEAASVEAEQSKGATEIK